MSDLANFRGPVPRPTSGSGGMGMPKKPSDRFRVRANTTEWQRLRDAKLGLCRVCGDRTRLGGLDTIISLHHLVFRSHGGDDIEDNLVPLHIDCHERVHSRDRDAVKALLGSLTDAEYSYAIEKAGEGFFERSYGLIYERAA